jgi:hypothetical protein
MSRRARTRKHPYYFRNRMWSREEIEDLGTTCPLLTAAEILSISRNAAYIHVEAGTFPVKVVRIGNRLRVVVPELVELLFGADERAEVQR